MKIRLRHLFEMNAFVAVFAALASIPYYGLGFCVLFAHIAIVGVPLMLGLWIVLTGVADGTQLKSRTPEFDGTAMRFTAACGVVVIIAWVLCFVGLDRIIFR